MSDIKVIEELLPWQVMKRASEGEPVASKKRGWSGNWLQNVDKYLNFSKWEYAIIDTSTPEIDWDKFDWDFFNQYGGLPVVDIDGVSYHSTGTVGMGAELIMPSPLYYWAGGEQPVPSNIEVEVMLRDGKSREYPLVDEALKFNWLTDGDHYNDVIAFRITGKVASL